MMFSYSVGVALNGVGVVFGYLLLYLCCVPSQFAIGGGTWTGWRNKYDQRAKWESHDQALRGVHSMHHNDYEDRIWEYKEQHCCDKAKTISNWTFHVNKADQTFNFENANKVIVGVESDHDGGPEDRFFKFRTKDLGLWYYTSGCYWTGTSSFDHEFRTECNDQEFMFGWWSRHDNGCEDRIFRFRCCRINDCHKTCETCEGPSENQCRSCISPNRLDSKTCKCPKTKYGRPGNCRDCSEGLEPNSDQSSCMDKNECTNGEHKCKANSKCVNTYTSYKCRCNLGWVMDRGNGRKDGSHHETCQTEGLRVSIEPTNVQLRLDMSQNGFSKYQVTVSEWDPSITIETKLSGYPTETGKTHVVDNLPPGTPYSIKIMPHDGSKWSTEHKFSKTVSTVCGCSYSEPSNKLEKTGSPTTFEVRQELGVLRFQWVDGSMCEEAFSFYRKKGDLKTSFIDDYSYAASERCPSRRYAPELVQDNLAVSNLDVGGQYTYCVEAISRDPVAPYHSDPTCTDIKIEFEASVRGHVTLEPAAGKIPVKGVTVIWKVTDTGIYRRAGRSSCVGSGFRLISTEDECGDAMIALGYASKKTVKVGAIDSPDRPAGCYDYTPGGNSHTFEFNKNADGVHPGWSDIHGVCKESEVSGTTVTDGTGEFYIHVKSLHLSGEERVLVTEFVKMSGDVEHKFLCETIPCKKKEIVLKHLTFDNEINVIDDTTVPFTGSVHIGGTEHDGLEKGCPLFNVTLCLMEASKEEASKEDAQLACTKTDERGRYSLPAVLGMTVYVKAIFPKGNHTFERVAYKKDAVNAPTETLVRRSKPKKEGGKTKILKTVLKDELYLISEKKLWEAIDFKDVTTETLGVTVVGGICNVHLGTSGLKLLYASCPSWEKKLTIKGTSDQWKVPAHELQVAIVEVIRNEKVRGEIPAYFGALLGASRSKTIDLGDMKTAKEKAKTEEKQGKGKTNPSMVRFEYHPPPTLKISFDKSKNSACRDVDDNMPLVLKRDSKPVATVEITENFGAGVPTCDVVEGNVTIFNQLGESQKVVDNLIESKSYLGGGLTKNDVQLLSKCREGCKFEIEFDYKNAQGPGVELRPEDRKRSHVDFEDLVVGEPNPDPLSIDSKHPHTKLFKASMIVLPHSPVEMRAFVVVVGSKPMTKKESVTIPEYMPMMVLHDPPGGLSYSDYNHVKARVEVEVQSHAYYTGGYANFELGAMAGDTINSCAGAFGVYFCNILGEFDNGIDGYAGGGGGGGPEKAEEKGQEFELSFSYQTTDDPEKPGRQSDMFLVPSLNIVFMETAKVSYDYKECKAKLDKKTEWALSGKDGKSNRDVFAWISETDINEREIPNLKRLLGDAKKKNPPEKEKISKLEEGIKGWEATIKENDATYLKAKKGELKKIGSLGSDKLFVGLAPEEMIKNPKPITGIKPVGGSNNLNIISTIKFSGGGSLSTFNYRKAITNSNDDGKWHKGEFEGGTNIHIGFKVLSVGLQTHTNIAIQHEQEHHFSDLTDTNDESSMGFVLGDPDSGDIFDVDVFIDPNYGTFVFNTLSGYSKCVHEPNTVPREMPDLAVVSSPLSPVFPDEPAIFELLLKNLGSEGQDFELFTLNKDNTGGLNIQVDGNSISQPIVYQGFAPGSIPTLVQVFRGPKKYKYKPITVGLRSMCCGSSCGDNEINIVEITPEFLRPCSTVELAGNLKFDLTFTVNLENTRQKKRANELRIVARNPNSGEMPWKEDSRLEKVIAEYRAHGDLVWKPCLNVAGQVVDVKTEENSFGYATAYWFVGPLPDGDYEVRMHTICTPSPGEQVPDGMDDNPSTAVWGTVDRVPPQQMGPVEPADLEYLPGDELSVTFDESLVCTKPFRFQINLVIEGVKRVFDKHNMIVVCKGRKIQLAFKASLPYDDIMDRDAKLVFSKIKDLADNEIKDDITISFRFKKFDLKKSGAFVEDLLLEMPFQPEMDDPKSAVFKTLASGLSMELATLLETDSSRLEVTRITDAGDAGIALNLKIHPATTLVSELKKQATISSSASGSAAGLSRVASKYAFKHSSSLNHASLLEDKIEPQRPKNSAATATHLLVHLSKAIFSPPPKDYGNLDGEGEDKDSHVFFSDPLEGLYLGKVTRTEFISTIVPSEFKNSDGPNANNNGEDTDDTLASKADRDDLKSSDARAPALASVASAVPPSPSTYPNVSLLLGGVFFLVLVIGFIAVYSARAHQQTNKTLNDLLFVYNEKKLRANNFKQGGQNKDKILVVGM